MESAERTAPRFPLMLASFPFVIKRENFGMAMPANRPMIATTIISSMRVNPCFDRRVFIGAVRTGAEVDYRNSLSEKVSGKTEVGEQFLQVGDGAVRFVGRGKD